MQQDQKQRNEWWKPRNGFCIIFILFCIFGSLILIFPYCPFYCFARDRILGSKNIQFIALLATLLGFNVVWVDLYSRLNSERKQREKHEDICRLMQEEEKRLHWEIFEKRKDLEGEEDQEKRGRIINAIELLERERKNLINKIEFIRDTFL